ncbi:MAG: adenylosuccinate lyase [Anaerolineaceae bacterium]|nr:adenylosuccinate lyase [Anaerolineaceae bacterium]
MDYGIYQSPFSWRYGTPKMRAIWGEENKRLIWRQIWVAMAKAQNNYGLVDSEQVKDLEKHANDLNIERSLEIEADIKHDLMAEVKAFAEQCELGGGIIHLGATSMDVVDNTDAIRVRQSLEITLEKTAGLLMAFCDLIAKYAHLPVMAYTHIQPAEPSSLGYRLAVYTQDLLEDWKNLKRIYDAYRGKGFKGAVGTAAAYGDLIGLEHFDEFEGLLSESLDLSFFPIATQTYTRKQDYDLLCALAGLGATIYKFAFDVRLLQTPSIGEISEPFGDKQVGSSAMPFKRNPVNAEKINSLARALAVLPQVAWQNAGHSLLERTLDDSANRRTTLPEAFLTVDEILRVSTRMVKGLQVHEMAIKRNLDAYAPFACTERVMMAAAKAGADRQEMHERLREHALKAWQSVMQGKENPLIEMLQSDKNITVFVKSDEIKELSNVNDYLGIAPARALEMIKIVKQNLNIELR